MSSATSASSSAGTYHAGWPLSFSSRKSFGACEPHDFHVLAQQRDERQEQRAIEPVLVELVRLDIRGRDHHDALLEQPREQPPEDHRIGDVGDVEFVEADQPGFLGQRVGDVADRIGIRDPAGLHLLAHGVEPLVHVGHELVEMRAAFASYRARREEQIHQHGLAAADVAMNVETADRTRLRRALGEQPAERRGLARQAMLREPLLEPGELRGDQLLRAIALDLAFGDEGRVTLGDGRWHRRFGKAGRLAVTVCRAAAARVNANRRAGHAARISGCSLARMQRTFAAMPESRATRS